MYKSKYKILQEAAGILNLYIYDEIEPDERNFWTDEKEPSETSASTIQKAIEEAGDFQILNVYINSYGGDVKEGLGIYNQIKRCKAQKTAYVDGFACSIASVIAMACDKVVMGTNTLMMIHNASMGAFGNSTDLRKAADDLDVINDASLSSYLTHAGEKLDEKALKTLCDAESWLSAKRCKDIGLCDEIVDEIADESVESEAAKQYKKFVSQKAKLFELKQKAPEVPAEYSKEKTNAERLMEAFSKRKGD